MLVYIKELSKYFSALDAAHQFLSQQRSSLA